MTRIALLAASALLLASASPVAASMEEMDELTAILTQSTEDMTIDGAGQESAMVRLLEMTPSEDCEEAWAGVYVLQLVGAEILRLTREGDDEHAQPLYAFTAEAPVDAFLACAMGS